MVVIIIRPLNKTGNLSIILLRIQKVVVYTSTVSIVSGIVFFGINTNYQYYKLFYTTWGNIIFGIWNIVFISLLQCNFWRKNAFNFYQIKIT